MRSKRATRVEFPLVDCGKLVVDRAGHSAAMFANRFLLSVEARGAKSYGCSKLFDFPYCSTHSECSLCRCDSFRGVHERGAYR